MSPAMTQLPPPSRSPHLPPHAGPSSPLPAATMARTKPVPAGTPVQVTEPFTASLSSNIFVHISPPRAEAPPLQRKNTPSAPQAAASSNHPDLIHPRFYKPYS